MATDEEVLTSLDHYERALMLVSDDFVTHGAPIEPRRVRLDDLDSIVIEYGIIGRGDTYLLGSLPMVLSVEEAAVELADILQEKVLEMGDTLWPGCIPGHSHPPTARLSSGGAFWTCHKNQTEISRIA